jgi:hypothetical protein
MKKIICTIGILFIGIMAFCQDVIITKAGEQIRAKIIEVTEDGISYKKYHDQEGATFIIKADKIKIISWENGDVDEYEKIAAEQVTPIVNENEILPYIDKKAGTFYLDNGQIYDAKQFKQFLIENNLSHIWMKYSNSKNLQIAGLGVIGGGVALFAIGCTLIERGDIFSGLIIGFPLTIIGGLSVFAGTPMAIVGTVRKHRAIDDYNTIYANKHRSQYSQNITFKAGFTGNGLGFSMNF